MRKLDHCNIVRLRYFFYSSGEKVRHWESKVCGVLPYSDAIPCLFPRGPICPSLFSAHLLSFLTMSHHLSFALQKDELYLNLVLEYVPETVYRVARHFTKAKLIIPIIYVKVGSQAAAAQTHKTRALGPYVSMDSCIF